MASIAFREGLSCQRPHSASSTGNPGDSITSKTERLFNEQIEESKAGPSTECSATKKLKASRVDSRRSSPRSLSGLESATGKTYEELLNNMRLRKARSLGVGKFGSVHAYADSTGRRFAVKRIYEQKVLKNMRWYEANSSDGSLMRGEGLALEIPHHPNVLYTYGLMFHNEDTGVYRFGTDFRPREEGHELVVGTLTEEVPYAQELDAFLKKYTPSGMREEELRGFAGQIGEGLAAIHRRRLIHRDVKPENILVDEENHELKVIDFGFLRNLTRAERGRAYTDCGTPDYVAPEVWTMAGHDQKADAWSFGVLLYRMATGTFPSFRDENHYQCMQNVIRFAHSGQTIEEKDKPILKKQRGRELSPELWAVLNVLLCHKDDRSTVAQALKMPFFSHISSEESRSD